MQIAIVGCGNISGIYFENLTKSDAVKVKTCCDLDTEKAREKAEAYGCEAKSLDEALADPEIGLVLNLTTPQGHFPIAKKALEAGKHVYGEKPLCLTVQEGQEILKLAREKNLRVGNAPDTFLGGGFQTCQKLMADGWIGEPVGFEAFMLCPGHESWHPAPEFYYQKGGGPLFDMGPYYLTALVFLLGPVEKVFGFHRISFPERTITSAPKYGQKVVVETATHICALLQFANGAIGNITTSFDVKGSQHPPIQIHGKAGSLLVPDPNGFGGPVSICSPRSERAFQEVPLTHANHANHRGLGVVDMVRAIEANRPHRANGDLSLHVLEIMEAILASGETGNPVELKTRCEKPHALAPNLRDFEVDNY